MAQTNYTPISLYYSTTAAAAPSAGNLVNGELAINITDGKLYFKNNSGAVTLLASAAGAAGDVVGPASSTDNALARFDATTGKLIQNSVGILSDAGVLTGLTGLTSSGPITLSSLTSGRVTYATTAGLLTDSANLTFNGTDLTVSGAVNAGTINATTLDLTNLEVTNIKAKDGTAGMQIADSTGVVSFTANPVISGGTANGVAYLNGSKVLTTGSALTFDGTVFKNTGTVNNEIALDTSGTPILSLVGGSGTIPLVGYKGVGLRFGTVTGTGAAGFSELMQLTSTGLGIGTSSPTEKLQVNGGIITTGAFNGTSPTGGSVILSFSSSTGSVLSLDPSVAWKNLEIGSAQTAFSISGSEQMRLTSTGLGIGTSSPSQKLSVTGNGNFTGWVNATGGGNGLRVDGVLMADRDQDNNVTLIGGSDNTLRLRTGSTTRATLDSSGNLGIGTSSPSVRLQTNATINTTYSASNTLAGGVVAYIKNASATNSTDATIRLEATGSANVAASSISAVHTGDGASALTFGTRTNSASDVTEKLRLDSSGNLGLGVTPSAWAGGFKAFDIAASSGGAVASTAGSVSLSQNTFYNGTNWIYKSTNPATRYEILGGAAGTSSHAWFTAPSGTAGNAISFTQAMTLDSNGNLLVGATSEFAGADCKIQAKNGSIAQAVSFFWNATTTGDANFVGFGTEASVTQRGSITYNRAGGLTAYNTTSDYRAKDIIGPVTDSGVLIDSVPVYMGKMKGATQERPMFIAHEVPAYAHTGEKDAVDADGNPVYQQMDVSALVPVLWAEIQSLRQRLAAAGI